MGQHSFLWKVRQAVSVPHIGRLQEKRYKRSRYWAANMCGTPPVAFHFLFLFNLLGVNIKTEKLTPSKFKKEKGITSWSVTA
jgi:hypothetical protein